MTTSYARMRQLISNDADWAALNPTLLQGEIAFSEDVRNFKVGPGQWASLSYYIDTTGGSEFITHYFRASGSGDIWTDANATDYTGQPDTEGALASVRVNSLAYFEHNGLLWVYRGTKPRKIGVGTPDNPTVEADFIPFGQLIEFNDISNNPYAEAGDGLETNPAPMPPALGDPAYPPAFHTHIERHITDLNRLRWRGFWANTTYLVNDVSWEDGWLGFCVNDTSDHVAPQDIAPPSEDMPDAPVWTMNQFTGVVYSGHTYEFTQNVRADRLQVWIPTLGADTNYRFVVAEVDADGNVLSAIAIEEPVLVEGQWTTIVLQESIWVIGQRLVIFIDALNSGADTTITGGWTRAANNNTITTDPGNAAWGTNNATTNLRINKTDLDGTGRGTELMSIVAGSTITFVNTANNQQSMSWYIGGDPVDQGTHVSWSNVTYDGAGSAGEPPVGATTTMTATVPVPSPTDYVSITPPPQDPTWATITGGLQLNGVPQSGQENIRFGVRVRATPIDKSDDWDIIPTSGSGGGGSGGGGDFPEAPQDGTRYGRQDAAWQPDPIQADAPVDATPYGRQDGAWAPAAPATHNHDDRYYTETEADGRFAPISHNHDDRYYTESEVDSQQQAQDAAHNAHVGDQDNPHNTTWDNLNNKPADFPPSEHQHLLKDILDAGSLAALDTPTSGLPSAMDKNGLWVDTAQSVYLNDAANHTLDDIETSLGIMLANNSTTFVTMVNGIPGGPAEVSSQWRDLVLHYKGNSNSQMQILYDHDGGEFHMYTRLTTNGVGAWQPWVKFESGATPPDVNLDPIYAMLGDTLSDTPHSVMLRHIERIAPLTLLGNASLTSYRPVEIGPSEAVSVLEQPLRDLILKVLQEQGLLP